jgi:hypothetical protein
MALAVLHFSNPHEYFLNRLENFQPDISDGYQWASIAVFASTVKEHQHKADARSSSSKCLLARNRRIVGFFSFISGIRTFDTHRPQR